MRGLLWLGSSLTLLADLRVRVSTSEVGSMQANQKFGERKETEGNPRKCNGGFESVPSPSTTSESRSRPFVLQARDNVRRSVQTRLQYGDTYSGDCGAYEPHHPKDKVTASFEVEGGVTSPGQEFPGLAYVQDDSDWYP